LALAIPLSAQLIAGAVDPAAVRPGGWLVLWATRGGEHSPIDSAQLDKRGQFRFKLAVRPTGYYQLGAGSDRVEVILNAKEPELRIRFDGAPLREHLQIQASQENLRLWEYKYASRDAQEQLRRISARRGLMDPRDADGLARLAQEEEQVKARLSSLLDRLAVQDSASYFSKSVLADKRLMAALPDGPVAIRDAMDWRDASLVRSSVYPRAIMALLQAATPALPAVLINASDSILRWASPDTACWSFARQQLTEVFSTYGPEEVVQHIVDRHVLGPGALAPPDGRLLALVAEQLKAAIGAPAPDAVLPAPLTGASHRLHDLVKQQPFTLLFFYSSTCDHCHEQMGPINALHAAYRERGLQVLGIALDADAGEFRRNIEERGLAFPCYSELMAWGSPAAKAFAVRATPSFILVNRAGIIVAKPHDAAELAELLPVLLP
jgi:peroxiredoxin